MCVSLLPPYVDGYIALVNLHVMPRCPYIFCVRVASAASWSGLWLVTGV